jgi:GTP-binding protein
MEIKSAIFVRGILGSNSILRDKLPKICFVGRSNVGKSSVINKLLFRKDLVKSSSLPGKTREINFFLVNDKQYFVDLPGYGYAKLSPQKSDKLRKLIIWFLSTDEVKLDLVFLIVDARVGLTSLDRDMLDILRGEDKNFVVLVNKSDKLKKNEVQKKILEIQAEAGHTVVSFSAKTGLGREEVIDLILKTKSGM